MAFTTSTLPVTMENPPRDDGYIATFSSCINSQPLQRLTQGSKLVLSRCQLHCPDLSWTLVVIRDYGEGATIRMTAISGQGKANVRFTGEILNKDTFGTSVRGAIVDVGTDGIVGSITSSFVYGPPQVLQVDVVAYFCDVDTERLQCSGLGADLGRLLDKGLHSDVELVVEAPPMPPGGAGPGSTTTPTTTRRVRAHKAVLSARSPYFRKLFQCDMSEARDDRVTVCFPAPVFDKVLLHVYTGSAGDLDGCEMDVMAAADYYGLEGLKRVCEERLLRQVPRLAPEEVLSTLVLADRYGAGALKAKALDVAADNLKRVRACPEWRDFSRKQLHLVDEVMGVVADKLEQAAEHYKKRKTIY